MSYPAGSVGAVSLLVGALQPLWMRPVFLTAITTILGLIPMAIGISYDFFNWRWIIGGESSQWWGPMAIAVIFGLAFATVLTLIIVPVMYSMMASISRAFGFKYAGVAVDNGDEEEHAEDAPATQTPAAENT